MNVRDAFIHFRCRTWFQVSADGGPIHERKRGLLLELFSCVNSLTKVSDCREKLFQLLHYWSVSCHIKPKVKRLARLHSSLNWEKLDLIALWSRLDWCIPCRYLVALLENIWRAAKIPSYYLFIYFPPKKNNKRKKHLVIIPAAVVFLNSKCYSNTIGLTAQAWLQLDNVPKHSRKSE